MKLSDEQCKKLYEISRNNDDPEWTQLYLQQKTAIKSHYQKVMQLLLDNPHLYRRSNIDAAENIIDEILTEVRR